MKFGTAWQGANLELIDKTTEIAPGITLIALVSEAPGTKELKELSLAVNTPDGLVLVVGCSHPGIDKIVEAAAAIDPKIQLIAGGFHLVVAPDDVIAKAVASLKDTFKVESIAPRPLHRRAHLRGVEAGVRRSVHLCRRRHLTTGGTEHGRRRTTWRGTGSRRGRPHHLSQARSPRRPLRPPPGAGSAITACTFADIGPARGFW
jgi:hypothetical protein